MVIVDIDTASGKMETLNDTSQSSSEIVVKRDHRSALLEDNSLTADENKDVPVLEDTALSRSAQGSADHRSVLFGDTIGKESLGNFVVNGRC